MCKAMLDIVIFECELNLEQTKVGVYTCTLTGEQEKTQIDMGRKVDTIVVKFYCFTIQFYVFIYELN